MFVSIYGGFLKEFNNFPWISLLLCWDPSSLGLGANCFLETLIVALNTIHEWSPNALLCSPDRSSLCYHVLLIVHSATQLFQIFTQTIDYFNDIWGHLICHHFFILSFIYFIFSIPFISSISSSFAVLRAFLVSFCWSVPPEFLRSFLGQKLVLVVTREPAVQCW